MTRMLRSADEEKNGTRMTRMLRSADEEKNGTRMTRMLRSADLRGFFLLYCFLLLSSLLPFTLLCPLPLTLYPYFTLNPLPFTLT
jgi:hypothetical protein